MQSNMTKAQRIEFIACLHLAIRTLANLNDLNDPTIDMIDELNDPDGNPGWFNSAPTENAFMAITSNVKIILKAINVARVLTDKAEPGDYYVDENLKYIFGDNDNPF